MRHTYSIGLDYGTLSLRGILVDTQTGEKMAEALSEYADGIIDQFLPQDEVRLPEGFALQNPQNYIDSTLEVLSSLVRTSGVQAHEIIGIGLDSTASTLIPVDKSFQPLCFQERFRKNPHAWIKLWKHHGAQEQADKLNHCARTMKMPFLTRIGGVLSSEYAYPKILETLEKAPEVYAATHRFMEIGDWIVWLLTGEETRNAVLASFHMQWDIEKGFPPNDFFRMVHPGLDGLVENKLGTNVHSAYSRAGGISQEIATRTGLLPGTSVCCANGDGNIPLSCLNIDREGIGALILGTSSVLMFLTKKPVFVGGSMGVVNSVLLPGYYGHVFGQSAAGDALAWYMENLLPHRYYLEAAANGISIYTLMDNKISQIAPGQNGLVGLDWYNGCRSLLMDSRLSAALIGINMHTRPEDIYRSIIESMAFGFRKILNTCKENGIVLNCIRACGGLARRNPALMQIFADVLGIRIEVSNLLQTVSLGAAISGAVAAGSERGGYMNILAAGKHMADVCMHIYKPDMQNKAAYDVLYAEYQHLYELFGKQIDCMANLYTLRNGKTR